MNDIELVGKIKELGLFYLSEAALFSLSEQVKNVNELNGIFIETGCALGSSAIVIANSMKKGEKLYLYDVFEMIPPPSDKDGEDIQQRYKTIKSGKSRGIGDNKYYGYVENLIDEIKVNFNSCGVSLENVHFIKGLYENTLNANPQLKSNLNDIGNNQASQSNTRKDERNKTIS